MASWLYTRHYWFVGVVLSTCFDAPKAIPFAWLPEEGYYFTKEAHMGFVALLAALEVREISRYLFCEILNVFLGSPNHLVLHDFQGCCTCCHGTWC